MVSRFTHSICAGCYEELYPDREPVRVRDGRRELCCFCGRSTGDCIFVRHDPEKLRCRGIHGSV